VNLNGLHLNFAFKSGFKVSQKPLFPFWLTLTIDGPRPQQQAKDTQERAQTSTGGQVLVVA
jgi:hypothetical protein